MPVTVGAVTSGGLVTVVVAGEPLKAVWELPALSDIENELALVNSASTALPPEIAEDVAVMVQTFHEV